MYYEYDDYDWCTEHIKVEPEEEQKILLELAMEEYEKKNKKLCA